MEGSDRLFGFVRERLPEVGHEKHTVRSGKRIFQRFRTVQIRENDFISQLRMLGRIARQGAHLELTTRLQRAHDRAPLLTGRADDGDDFLSVRHGYSPAPDVSALPSLGGWR